MAKRKRPYNFIPFESTDGKYTNPNTGKTRKDTTANISASMLFSAAFQSLENRQKVLYLYMKGEFFLQPDHQRPARVYPEAPGLEEKDFFFTWSMAKQTGLYKDGSRATFSRDVKALEQKGFISTIFRGDKNGRKSVYRYSGNWKNAPF